MKRISKKILICSLTVATTTAAISWPIASSVLVTNHHNYGFIFEDQKFDSKDEIYHYVKNKSQKINTTQETNDSWWIIDDGKNKVYFADPESLRNYANQYITTRIVHSAYDLGQYINPKDGSLGTTADTQEIWEYINWDYNNKNEIQIFRGKDGTPFLTEQEAKNSYLSVSNGYYFNQIYFPSKEILKKYLYESYNSLFKTNSITVKAPNNEISAPLFKNDQNFEIKLNSFIKSNSYKFLEYNTNENKKIILNKSNYKNELSKIKINDLSYVRMYSNEGRQNYIIDLDKTDQYQLYGPYFYNGVLDIGNFSNKDSWKKIDEVNNNALTGNQINELIGNFFSLILGDFSIGDEVNKFFDIPLSIFDNRQNKEISLDEEYISSIKGFSNELYANIKKMVQDLNQGKRFNSFYKIPILYNYIIQNLVYFNADENLFNETIKYFSLIADYLQTIIEFIVPNEKFLFKKDNTKKFNVKEFFCIGNSEYNTNTTVEYFMNEIKQYDLLIASMITYSSAITNINAFSGVIPLNQQIYQALLDNSIITKKKLNDNLSTLNEIYKLFSKTSYNDFLEFLNNLSNFDNIKIAVANSESKELKILKTLLIRNNLIVNITDFILNKSLENNNYSILETLNNKARMVYDLLQSNNSNNLTKWQAFIISYCIGSANVEFQINYNTILQDFYIWFSNNPISIFILNNIVKLLPWMFQNFSTYYNYNHVIREISGKFGIDFSSHKEIINVLKSVTNILGAFQKLKFIPYLEAVLSCIEIGLILLEGIVGKEKSFGYVYKTQDGTEFVWDGGRSQEFFWGLVKNDTLTINDMKLLQPIEINKPQLEDYYYWNKKKYSSTDELKSDQIYWLLNQNNIDMITYPSFKFKYTFDNINDVDNNNSSNNNIVSFDSEENLLEYVKNDINKQNSKYLYKNLFAFSTGQKIENNEQLKEVKINNIIDNIRQTKIIQLPKLFNGFPIAKSAVSPFEYPERSWYNGQIIENSKNYNYIIDNSANALKENKQLSDLIDKTHYLTPAISNAEKKAYNNVIYRFYELFNVESKVVPISELNSKNNYDNMLFYIGNQLLYEVKLPNGIKNYFYYAKDATKWMMSELNFIKYGIYKTETSFIYNNQSFRNEDELIDWIDQKITII